MSFQFISVVAGVPSAVYRCPCCCWCPLSAIVPAVCWRRCSCKHLLCCLHPRCYSISIDAGSLLYQGLCCCLRCDDDKWLANFVDPTWFLCSWCCWCHCTVVHGFMSPLLLLVSLLLQLPQLYCGSCPSLYRRRCCRWWPPVAGVSTIARLPALVIVLACFFRTTLFL